MRRFLRVGRVIQDGHCRREDGAFAGLHEAIESLSVALASAADEFRLTLWMIEFGTCGEHLLPKYALNPWFLR